MLHCSFFLFHSTCAQTGTWQTHFSYRSARTVAAVESKIYSASENGFFYLDLADRAVTRLSPSDGFSETGVTRLRYLPDRRQLLITYRSGTVEFLSVDAQGEPGALKRLTLIRDASQIPGSKRINGITRLGDQAFLATDFGIVVLDLLQAEIRDSYRNLGPNGAPAAVYSLAATADSLYAATSAGLLAARQAPTVNLAFFGSWRLLPLPGSALPRSVVVADGRLLVGTGSAGVLERRAGSWVQIAQASDVLPLESTFALAASGLIQLPNQTVNSPLLGRPLDLTRTGTTLWIADSLSGLLQVDGNQLTPILPDGPASDRFQRLYAIGGQVLALPGGAEDGLQPLNRRRGFDRYRDGRWITYDQPTLPLNFGAAAYHPVERRLYAASYGGGLWVVPEEGLPTNVPLSTPLDISSLAASPTGDLWMTTPRFGFGQNSLHRRGSTGPVQSFSPARPEGVEVILDEAGKLWLRLSPLAGGGILVYDPANGRSRLLYAQANEGNLPDNTVRALTKDRFGSIWVGTNNGVAVFDNPTGVLSGPVNAYLPVVGQRRLLAGEAVTAIAVDGANRKWLGTRNGLYLVNPEGTEILEQFTTGNSPLPGNTIEALAVEPLRGDVFVATTGGLVSYRGTATEPVGALQGITVYPNPIRPEYGGPVTIDGLVDQSVVKILDAAGQLVYETRSQGGRATWNLRDYRGRAPETGVYFIIAIRPDGTEGLAGKLAIVR